MIVINDVKPEIYKQISELVESGHYPSAEVFVEVAVNNQLLLEKSSNYTRKEMEPIRTGYNSTFSNNTVLRNIEEKPITINPIEINQERNSLPMWGLINRFTPSKIILRSLANMLSSEKRDAINFKEFSEKMAGEALKIRAQLEKFEKRSEVTRGESFKMGFPTKDAKSQQRFIDIFIGRLRSDNTVGGILGELEFAVVKKVQNGNAPISVVGITDYGLGFAQLHSPIIDDLILNQQPISNPLSDEEVNFLLNHIKKVRSEDFRFLSFLYRSVKEGVTSPQELSKVVLKYFDRNKLSETFINSFQAGAMARLVEMRLIRIEKHGIYSSYRAETSKIDFDNLLSATPISNN